MQYVPVVSGTGKPLMPCHPARARELVRKGRAVRRFLKGIFHIQLLDRKDGAVQRTACGIDPGSKQEGYSIRSEKRTFLNLQADAVTWVKDQVEVRRQMRRDRRYRKTPCRMPRFNRARGGGLPPSTKARWQWKLRVCRVLARLYPIAVWVVEDIKARTKSKRRWETSFSPLQVGKSWFYGQLRQLGQVVLKSGWETKQLRDKLGLKKTNRKTAEVFSAHCVDAWVLAWTETGGVTEPDQTRILRIAPIRLHRRQLHRLQPDKGGVRKPYGGTRSLGFKRGGLVYHPKWGVAYVGGTTKGRISLHRLDTGKRLCQNARPEDLVPLAYNTWKVWHPGAALSSPA